jgi:hypothetical protein
MHTDSGRSRSWPDYGSEDLLSLEACRSHINNAMALLMALQGAPSVENEMRSLQAILSRIEDLGISDIEFSTMSNDSGQQHFYKQSSVGNAIRSYDFPRASAEHSDGVEAFNAPLPMNGFQDMTNNDPWDSGCFSMLFNSTGSKGATTALYLDRPMPLDMPIFHTSTNAVTHASHWESNVGSFAVDLTCQGLLNEDATLYV